MLRSTSFLALSLLLVITSLSSCKKKCVISKEIVDGGVIIKNVIFYPNSGNMTQSMSSASYLINANSPYADRIQVGINGAGKAPVDYSQYNVLCLPVKTKCNAAFDRKVTIDAASQNVTYTIIATQCSNCDQEWYTENYVLVPTFPASYTVTYDVQYVNK
jgi:hypothetical protein